MSTLVGTGTATAPMASSTGTLAEAPAVLRLGAARPNPATFGAVVPFELSSEAAVEAVLYDGLGRRVAVVASGTYGAGFHAVRVDGTALPAGVYVVHLTARTASGAPVVAVARLTLVR